jgi:predicted alpha/beta hydrolase family esterase
MKKQVLFIHGGGDNSDEAYKADSILANSLQEALDNGYKVSFPHMKEERLPDFGWPQQISDEINKIGADLFLVGHSLGASMILKYLTEMQVSKKIKAVYLLAPPHWTGTEDWKQGLKLKDDFAEKLPNDIPIFLYQCMDDDVVPYTQYTWYVQKLPHATVHAMKNGGHQFNNDLSFLAEDIKKSG